MADRVVLVAGEDGDVVLATSPRVAGGTALMTALFGIDGVNVGSDADGADLVFPVSMSEGGSGVYSATVNIVEPGLYFAEFTVGGASYGPVVVRVLSSESSFEAEAEAECTIGIVAVSAPASVQLTVTDREGTSAGTTTAGDAIVWPQAATVVPGHAKCFYYDDLVLDEGGKYHLAMQGPTGPVWTDSLSVHQPAQGSASHFDGWTPDAAYSPSDWVSIAYIRRMTGWSASTVSDVAVRELRRMAIETFIERTNRWFPPWTGTWHGLRGQGERLYLPVPVLMVQDGAAEEPTVTVTQRYGDKDDLEEISADNLVWRVRGPNERQPYVQVHNRAWDSQYDVKIEGTFGSVGLSSQVPIAVKQCIVGLVRWHSLSYGQGPDEARDQATLNRIKDESSRDRSVSYHDSAISSGLTGDPVVDRALANFTISPGPWARNRGDM